MKHHKVCSWIDEILKLNDLNECGLKNGKSGAAMGIFKAKPFKDKKLKTLLNQLETDDLDLIAEEFFLEPVKGLEKQELINQMIGVYSNLLTRSFDHLCSREFNLILECHKQGGFLALTETEAESDSMLFYLGMVFPVLKEGQYYAAVPDELSLWINQSDLAALAEKAKENHTIKQYVIGIVNLYGIFPMKQFIKLYQEQNQILLNLKRFYELINTFDVFDGYFHINGLNEYIYHFRAEKNLYSLIRKVKNGTDLDYYPFTKEQILNAGKKDYHQKNEVYQRLVRYLKTNLDHSDLFGKWAEDLYYLAVSGQVQEALSLIVSEERLLNIPDFNKLIKSYIEFFHQAHQWPLKGNTQNELNLKSESQK